MCAIRSTTRSKALSLRRALAQTVGLGLTL